MRIWDIDPGYLNRQSLLGEHRELHAIVSIITHGKKGYSNHPETVRWKGHVWALAKRHQQLKCEMELRGFADRSPVRIRSRDSMWPSYFVDVPGRQFQLLKTKYVGKDAGRIPLPTSVQQLWSHHKYSVLARDQNTYRRIGRDVSDGQYSLSELALLLTDLLRRPPTAGGARNAVQHMWGHVSRAKLTPGPDLSTWSVRKLLRETQKRAMETNQEYLVSSTALGELMAWMPVAG